MMGNLRVVLAALVLPAIAAAEDACRPWGILARADVSVSDGSSFITEAVFHGPRSSAIRHRRESGDKTVAVEGAQAWVKSGDQFQQGGEFHKLFALGHQYHALLLYFDELVADVQPDSVQHQGLKRASRAGVFPYGGRVHLLEGAQPGRPWGFRFDFPEHDPIWVQLGNWRPLDSLALPYTARIDDGERTFVYSYTDIRLNAGNAAWFHAQLPAPPLDALALQRLHRDMLVAHCAGDAQRLAELTSPVALSVNGGELTEVTPEQIARRFSTLFNLLDYRQYDDLTPPRIEIAKGGDIGWAAVEVRARGVAVESGKVFDDQWAWVMLARKVDGVWRHAGNASNRKAR